MIDQTIKKVAQIARLNLSQEEIERFAEELEEVERAFSKIKEIDTQDVEPAFHPIPLKNSFREDEPKESLPREVALSNTEHKENGYFKGPRIV